MKNPKDDFEKLQKKWYAKLKKSGFEDAESDEYNLKVWSSVFFAHRSISQIQAKQAYYQMATNFLVDYKFENERDKIIWEYHSNGMSVRDIGKVLRKVGIRMNFMTVWRVVNKMRAKMYDMYMSPKRNYRE